MSWHAVKLVKDRRSSVSSSARFVLWILAEHADEQFQAWPAVARLASISGLSERRVRSALHELERAGEVEVVRSPGRVSVFLICPGTPAQRAGVTPAQFAGVPRHSVPGSTPPTPAQFAGVPRHGVPGTPAQRADDPPKNLPDEPPLACGRAGAGVGVSAREADPIGGGEDLPAGTGKAAEVLREFGVAMPLGDLVAGMTERDARSLVRHARKHGLRAGAVVELLRDPDALRKLLASSARPVASIEPEVPAPRPTRTAAELEADKAARLAAEAELLARACKCGTPDRDRSQPGLDRCTMCGGSIAGRFLARRRRVASAEPA